MSDQPSRMEVGAAIEALLEGHYEKEYAKTLIRFGHSLPVRSRFFMELLWRKSGDDGTTDVIGHTNEYGDVSFEVKNEERSGEVSFGVHKERVGYYKIWRERKDLLEFHHFWKSDLATVGEPSSEPTHYRLCWDPATLEPVYFGEIASRVVWSFGWFSLIRWFVKILAFSREEEKLLRYVLGITIRAGG